MIVTINTIDDKKEKLLAVCNITVDPGIFPKSRFCRHILMYCRLAFRMQNVIMVH